jgi:hypothetical protein
MAGEMPSRELAPVCLQPAPTGASQLPGPVRSEPRRTDCGREMCSHLTLLKPAL